MDYTKIYDKDYFNGKKSFFHRFGYGNLSKFYFNDLFKPIYHHIKKFDNGNVLDVGCAYGYMLQRFPDSFQKFGIDISEHAICTAKKRLPHAILKVGGAEDEIYFKENFFDVILLNDVLEHLKQPELALKNTYKSLKKEGILYITTPNLNSIRKRIFKYADKKEHHISLLPHADLNKLLSSLNFQVIERCTFINFPIYLKFKSNRGTESAFICKK